jgi:hypothetical protein
MCILLFIGSLHFLNVYASGWRTASSTFYGNNEYNGDRDKITDGTCSCAKARTYGICYNNWCFESIGNPKMVTAINTPRSDNTRMCGKCVRLRCVSGRYRGLPWSEFGEDDICYSREREITLQITDSCPEIHRNPSNKKFCNMAHRHFDMSFWAFGLLAPHKYGVIDIEYRFVNCPKNLPKTIGTVNNTCCKEGTKCLGAVEIGH